MNSESIPERYWFRAKRYGWGWGLPATWEGWLFTLAWLAVTLSVTLWLGSIGHTTYTYGFLILMLVVLLIVCFTKGEPPRWRWGGKDLF